MMPILHAGIVVSPTARRSCHSSRVVSVNIQSHSSKNNRPWIWKRVINFKERRSLDLSRSTRYSEQKIWLSARKQKPDAPARTRETLGHRCRRRVAMAEKRCLDSLYRKHSHRCRPLSLARNYPAHSERAGRRALLQAGQSAAASRDAPAPPAACSRSVAFPRSAHALASAGSDSGRATLPCEPGPLSQCPPALAEIQFKQAGERHLPGLWQGTAGTRIAYCAASAKHA